MEQAQIRMIDVTEKKDTERRAVANSMITMKPSTLELIRKGRLEKGDVLAVARTAGIMAAKETPRLIPLCHPLRLTSVAVEIRMPDSDYAPAGVEITATTKGIGKTGFEMEALVAVTVCALTIYDMCKAVDQSMTISDIRLIEKSGGKSDLRLAGA